MTQERPTTPVLTSTPLQATQPPESGTSFHFVVDLLAGLDGEHMASLDRLLREHAEPCDLMYLCEELDEALAAAD